jgi:hypothetical protein
VSRHRFIHDEHGPLVRYAGRLVQDRKVSDEKRKYLISDPGERDQKEGGNFTRANCCTTGTVSKSQLTT